MPNGAVALSNTESENLGASPCDQTAGCTSQFLPTPPMSPYLLAVAAGALQQYTAGSAGGNASPYRFWSTRAGDARLELAAERVPDMFKFYQDYFDPSPNGPHNATAGAIRGVRAAYNLTQGVALPPEFSSGTGKVDFVAVPGKAGAMEVRALARGGRWEGFTRRGCACVPAPA